MGVDADAPVDAPNAPTRWLAKPHRARFRTAPTPVICFLERHRPRTATSLDAPHAILIADRNLRSCSEAGLFLESTTGPLLASVEVSGSSSVFHSSPFDDFKGTRPTHTDAPSMTRRSGSVERSFSSFSRDGELRIDFSSRLEQCVVELRTEEERRGAQTIEFWTNRLEQARALRCDQRAKRANHT